MTSASSNSFPGEVNSFLVALQDESEFANSLRQATSIKVEDEVLESQGFHADVIRRELQQVTFTDPVSFEKINLLSWMNEQNVLRRISDDISLTVFVEALSTDPVLKTLTHSPELRNFVTTLEASAGGSGASNSTNTRIKRPEAVADDAEAQTDRDSLSDDGIEPRKAFDSTMLGDDRIATFRAQIYEEEAPICSTTPEIGDKLIRASDKAGEDADQRYLDHH